MEAKPMSKSLTVRASISNLVAVFVMIVAVFGIEIDMETQGKIVIAGVALWKVVNDILAIYGRIRATQPIERRKKPVDWTAPKMWGMMIFLPVMTVFMGCAGASQDKTVKISGFQLLVITDIATDNIAPVEGPRVDLSATIPASGVPVPVNLGIEGGGIMSANVVDIRAATGGTVIIDRAAAGNLNLPVPLILSKILRPTSHPFGNVTVDQGSALREHVIDQAE